MNGFKIVDTDKNWRIVIKSDDEEKRPWLEIQSSDGNWIWPDCRYSCSHCDKCLGCVRKFSLMKTDDGFRIDSNETCCESSPNGMHNIIEDDDDDPYIDYADAKANA